MFIVVKLLGTSLPSLPSNKYPIFFVCDGILIDIKLHPLNALSWIFDAVVSIFVIFVFSNTPSLISLTVVKSIVVKFKQFLNKLVSKTFKVIDTLDKLVQFSNALASIVFTLDKSIVFILLQFLNAA